MGKETPIEQAEITALGAWEKFDTENPGHIPDQPPVYHPGISAKEIINYRPNIRNILEIATGTFVFTGLHLLSRKLEIENELVMIAGIAMAASLIKIGAPAVFKRIVNRFRQS